MQNCLGEEILWDYREGVTFAVPRTNEGTAQMCTVNFCFVSQTDSAFLRCLSKREITR